MLALIRERLPEALRAVAPMVGVVVALQVSVVRAPAAAFLGFLAGAALAAFGMALLFAGIDMGILPMGRFIGAELPRKGSLTLILGVAFALGVVTTVAEPDVIILAGQVEAVSGGAIGGTLLTYVVAGGVGLAIAAAIARIIHGFPMPYLLAGAYAVMLLLSLVSSPRVVPLAYDAGSVTTGVLTAPVVLALALGFNSVLAGRSAVHDGFGLLGLASVGAIVAVLLLGLLP